MRPNKDWSFVGPWGRFSFSLHDAVYPYSIEIETFLSCFSLRWKNMKTSLIYRDLQIYQAEQLGRSPAHCSSMKPPSVEAGNGFTWGGDSLTCRCLCGPWLWTVLTLLGGNIFWQSCALLDGENRHLMVLRTAERGDNSLYSC